MSRAGLLALACLTLACTTRPLGLEGEDELGDASTTGAGETTQGTDSSDSTTTASEDTSASGGCSSDADCEVGNCIDGACQTCAVWDDCYPFWGDCANVDCVEGTCVSTPWDCSLANTACHEPVCFLSGDPTCGVDFCDVYDGVVDARIDIVATQFAVHPALDLGGELELFGKGGGNCQTLRVVRDRVGDALLLATSSGLAPELATDWPELFGRTWDELAAPLVVRQGDAGCVSDDPCETRGAIDVALGDAASRVLDGNVGMAPGGHFVRTRFAHFGVCRSPYVYSGFSILRDACTGNDCPAPTYHDTCIGESELPPDDFTIQFYLEGTFQNNPAAHWHFECVVIDAEVVVDDQGQTIERRDLDCAAISQAFYPTWCT